MKIEFPRELRQQLERAIVEGEFASDQVWTLGELANRFEYVAALWPQAAKLLKTMVQLPLLHMPYYAYT